MAFPRNRPGESLAAIFARILSNISVIGAPLEAALCTRSQRA